MPWAFGVFPVGAEQGFFQKIRLRGEWANDFFKLGLVVITRTTWIQMWGRSFSLQLISEGPRKKEVSIHRTGIMITEGALGCPVLDTFIFRVYDFIVI